MAPARMLPDLVGALFLSYLGALHGKNKRVFEEDVSVVIVHRGASRALLLMTIDKHLSS